MADVSVTAASVAFSTQAVIRREYTFGETVTVGQVVYLNSSNQWMKTDSNAGTSGNLLTDLRGIAVAAGNLNQPAAVCTSDPGFTVGGTIVNGTSYYTSNTAGAISNTVPTTGDYPTFLGLAKSTTVLNLNPIATGVVI